MPVKSMTGYGRANAVIDGTQINIDIKSVNHRYFDFNAKISKEYVFVEDKVKKIVNENISRGKIDLYLYINSDAVADYELELNQPLAAGYVNAFKTISKKLKVKNDISASFLTRMPEVVRIKKSDINEQKTEDSVKEVLKQALASFDAMRVAEGKKLYVDLVKNLDIIEKNVEEIERLAPESIEIYREKLKNRMLEALEGKEYDEQRLIMEVAIFADRIDIGEETVRLKSHLSQFRNLIDSDGQPVGKKLDFIVQEMNREVNTIGSKCNSIDITNFVVDTKSVIEKIREQIQNIE